MRRHSKMLSRTATYTPGKRSNFDFRYMWYVTPPHNNARYQKDIFHDILEPNDITFQKTTTYSANWIDITQASLVTRRLYSKILYTTMNNHCCHRCSPGLRVFVWNKAELSFFHMPELTCCRYLHWIKCTCFACIYVVSNIRIATSGADPIGHGGTCSPSTLQMAGYGAHRE